MKSTGFVRRFDDIGRISIPKEVRRVLRIREGDPIEIFYDEKGIFLKKYSKFGQFEDFIDSYTESLAKTTGCSVLITDTDTVITVAGVERTAFIEKPLSFDMREIMRERVSFLIKDNSEIPIELIAGGNKHAPVVAIPILSECKVVGLVIFFSTQETTFGEVELRLAKAASGFLGKQMEG